MQRDVAEAREKRTGEGFRVTKSLNRCHGDGCIGNGVTRKRHGAETISRGEDAKEMKRKERERERERERKSERDRLEEKA